MPSGVNLGTSTRRAPLRTASRLTQMPKMKVRRSGTTTVSCAVRPRSRSSTASLPAIRSWPMTTPFGLPVLPEVKMIRAASRKCVPRRRASRGDAFDPTAIHPKARARCLLGRVGGESPRIGRDRHHHTAGEPDPEHGRKVQRRVGDGRQDRLSRLDGRQIGSDRPGLGEQVLRRDGRPVAVLDRRLGSPKGRPRDTAPERLSRRGLREARIAPGQRRLEPVAARDVHELDLVRRARALDGQIDLERRLQRLEHALRLAARG